MLILKFNRFGALAIVGALVACGPATHTTFPGLGFPSAENYKASELSFASVNDRVFRMNCISCHGQSAAINLQNYSSVKANLSRVYQAVLVNRTMPKFPGHLTADQLGLLNAWIRAGAPEKSTGGIAPIPLAPTFESIRYNILEPKCLQCHAPGKSVARIPLGALDDLLNSPLDLVVPGNSEESGLMIAIQGLNPKKTMPPANYDDGSLTGFSRLSDLEIATIAEWISGGAK